MSQKFTEREFTALPEATGGGSSGDSVLYGESADKQLGTSTSAYPWKGTAVVPQIAVTIHRIIMFGTIVSGADYQGAIITESSGTIASITKTATVTANASQAETVHGVLTLTFTSAVDLTGGTEYYITVGRTDSTDTYALPIQYPSTRSHFPFGSIGTNSSIRIAKASPAVSDTTNMHTTAVVRLGAIWSYT